MSATEQRTGFRLPWATEAKPADPSTDEPVADEDGWPTVDRGHDDPATERSAPAPTDPSAQARRSNPLVAGLVRAMREAAAAARAEASTGVASEAEARIVALREETATRASSLRRKADEDLAAIRDWSKAELARIREETERRSADRRAHLEHDLADGEDGLGRHVDAVHAALADFERRLGAFYDLLMAEEDPARLAGLAERLPSAPDLDDLESWLPPARTAAPAEGLDAADAAAAEAAAMAETDALADDAPAAEAVPAVAPSVDASPALHGAMTQVIVTGLTSVASIAGVKRGLTRIAGVRAVGVNSGPEGEFVFRVEHAPTADLEAGLAALTIYAPTVGRRADGAIDVSAVEPNGHD